MLEWVFRHYNAVVFFIAITGGAGLICLKIWRYCHRYPNLFKKILHEPPKTPQGGVHYPPPAAGIEVKSQTGFLATYLGLPKSIKIAQELTVILAPHIDLLKFIEMATETANVFEKRYWPAIERYARLVHMLPASAEDHHFGPGGLLYHGLQVGYFALLYARHSLYGMKMGEKKREARERYLFAAFVDGMSHDIGRVLTDVKVRAAEGGRVWTPSTERLLDWAISNRVSIYYVDWEPNRHKLHEKAAPQMLNKVLTDEDSKFIGEIDGKLLEEFLLTIGASSNSPIEDPLSKYSNGLLDMVCKADRRSVEEDLKKSRNPADLGIQRPTPMVQHYTDGMRQLIKKGKWEVFAASPEISDLGELLPGLR